MTKQIFTRDEVKALLREAISRLDERAYMDFGPDVSSRAQNRRHLRLAREYKAKNPELSKIHHKLAKLALTQDTDGGKYDDEKWRLHKKGIKT